MVIVKGRRTLEKDFKVISWNTTRNYCEKLIEKLKRKKKKELETTKLEDLILFLALKMYTDTRKEMLEQSKNKIIKEIKITERKKKKEK